MFSLRRLSDWAFLLESAILAISLSACSSPAGNSGPGRALSSIAVTPPTASINVGAMQQFNAKGTYSDGSTQDITTTAQWASLDTTVATIQSNSGLATGAAIGTAQITASLSGVVSPPASLSVTTSGASTPALVQHVSSSNTRSNNFSSPFCYHFQLPNPTTAGNAVVVGFTFNGNPSPTVTDDGNDVYAVEANHFDSADTQSVGIAAAFNVAAGARTIKLCFSADPGGFVQPMATEFSNVTGIDGGGAGADGSGTSAAAGSMTPSLAGDLVYQVVSSFTTLPSQSSFSAGVQPNINWGLLSADLMDGFAGQYGVYNSTATINPTIAMGTSQKWVTAAVLLKAGPAGGVPTGMRIVHLMHENIPSSLGGGGSGNPFPSTIPLQLASSGNLLVAMIGGGNPSNTVSSITDTKTNTWTQAGVPQVIANNDTVQAFFAANATSSPDLALTLNWSSNGGGDFTIFFYDVAGAATSPLDSGSVVGTTGTQPALGDLTLPFSVTPASANEIIFVQTIWDANTGVGLTGAGQFFDANWFDGESLGGPEPVDENNGWGHVPTTNTTPVTFTWIPKDLTQQPFGNWAAMALAFKAGP